MKNKTNNSKIFKVIITVILVCSLILSAGCMSTRYGDYFNNNSTVFSKSSENVLNYLSNKYPNESSFTIDEQVGYGVDVNYTEYYCHSANNQRFVVYENEDGSFQDNYYGVLIYDDYKNRLDNILSDYFDNYKVYIRFTSNFFDDDIIDVDKFDDYLENDPQQFFADYFIFVSEDDKEKLISLDTSKLNRELRGEFVNYFISINIVDDNVFNSDTLLNENTYLSVEKTKVYSETIK